MPYEEIDKKLQLLLQARHLEYSNTGHEPMVEAT